MERGGKRGSKKEIGKIEGEWKKKSEREGGSGRRKRESDIKKEREVIYIKKSLAKDRIPFNLQALIQRRKRDECDGIIISYSYSTTFAYQKNEH